ncbi:DUF4238 domain-containing protein [Methanoculleus sp.]|uniref:DUF4238 domain-containing protein n=1 Tax=Methanoculleus sp. TaxID=90427 RepID=UPI001BD3726F|nr:DUF4238 domain-containing protein [Methanoculleus sp.]
MAENKRQHFVPQFYLRNFSIDGEHVYVYNLESSASFYTQIRTSCQEKYFYGEGAQIEKALAPLENRQAEVLRKITETCSISSISPEERILLQSFTLLQYARTKDAKENCFDKMAQQIGEHVIKPMMKSSEDLKNKGITDEDIDSRTITHPGAHGSGMLAAIQDRELISDLKLILLVNKTDHNFITSDTPVVKNNYLQVKNSPLTGFLSPGLQIFVPLNPTLCLLFIDENSYHIRECGSGLIELSERRDILDINLLQLLNCQKNSFYSSENDTRMVKDLHDEAKSLRKDKQFRVRTVRRQQNTDGTASEVVTWQFEGVNYRRKFSFIKLDHEYNRRFKGEAKHEERLHGFFRPSRRQIPGDMNGGSF